MQEESLEQKYEKAFAQAAAGHPIFPASAKQEMAQMVEVIARGNENITNILSTNQADAVKGGFVAEEFHAETFNLDASLKGDSARAYTDRYGEWADQTWNGQTLKKNDVPDIAVVRDGKVSSTAQAKYYRNAETTAREMSQVDDGRAKYGEVDTLLGPEDQINSRAVKVPGESEPVATTTVREHAEAKAEALEARGGDSAEIEAYKQTAAKSRDRIQDGKASSARLSKEEADAMGGGDTKKLKDIEREYQTRSTVKQMGNAAVGAAAMSAVVCGASNTVRYVQLAREGKLTPKEAALKIVGETVASAADSAVKAAANVGAQSLLVRYGGREVAKQLLARQGLQCMLRTNAVTVGVVCAIDAVKDLVRLGMGEISKEEFFERQGKGLMMTSAGVMGGTVGTMGASAVAASLGVAASSTAMSVAALVGGLSGGMIAGLAMTLAIENGIEKPYRDLVRNTGNLHSAAVELERVSRRVLQGQVVFTKFLEADQRMENELQAQFLRIDAAGQRALDAINRI